MNIEKIPLRHSTRLLVAKGTSYVLIYFAVNYSILPLIFPHPLLMRFFFINLFVAAAFLVLAHLSWTKRPRWLAIVVAMWAAFEVYVKVSQMSSGATGLMHVAGMVAGLLCLIVASIAVRGTWIIEGK